MLTDLHPDTSASLPIPAHKESPQASYLNMPKLPEGRSTSGELHPSSFDWRSSTAQPRTDVAESRPGAAKRVNGRKNFPGAVKHAAWIACAVLLTACGGPGGTASGDSNNAPGGNGSSQQPPSLYVPAPQPAKVGQLFVIQPVASDAEGDTLTFEIVGKPDWANFNAATGELSGIPGLDDAGSRANIRIIVSDGTSSTESNTMEIVVEAAPGDTTPPPSNQVPSISGSPSGAVNAGSAYRFQPQASDPDGDQLSFQIRNRPTWASFDSKTGLLSGTPSDADVGITSGIQIGVSDGQSEVFTNPFGIEVIARNLPPVNNAPVISGTPASSVTVGNPYAFTPRASDADGDTLQFSIQNLPIWASFNSSTGTVSGTPTDIHVGNYSNIQISVSDGMTSTPGQAFNIQVVAGNHAPTLGGSPGTSVRVGEAYRFQPTSSDQDGDSLRFSVENLPSWASFDTGSGQITGTPSTSDVGLYSSIRISVTDGVATTRGAAFSIEVTQVSLGSATLSWTAPTENMDGSALTDLAGFTLYYGVSEGSYTEQIRINNPGISTYVVDNLTPDTYYFVATAYNSSGVESPFSAVAVKVVN